MNLISRRCKTGEWTFLIRASMADRFILILLALAAYSVAAIEINRSGAMYDLSAQVEIVVGQSEVNTLQALSLQREIERRENRCFHWGGK